MATTEAYRPLIEAAEWGELPRAATNPADPFEPDDYNVDVLRAAKEGLADVLDMYAQLLRIDLWPYDSVAGEEHLRTLFSDPTTPGWIELRSKSPESGRVERCWVRPSEIGEEAAWIARMNRRGWPVWVGIALRKSTTDGGGDNLHPCGWLWADMDSKDYEGGLSEAEQRIGAYTPAPRFVVYSGGGLHPYWPVQSGDGRLWRAALQGQLQRVARDLGADPHAAEPARVLRLAGTWNRKGAEPVKVRMVTYA